MLWMILTAVLCLASYWIGREIGWVAGEGYAERRQWAQWDARHDRRTILHYADPEFVKAAERVAQEDAETDL